MRIATSTIFDVGAASMQSQEAALAVLTNQISSSKSVNSPVDNPAAAAQAVQVQTALTANSQYTSSLQSLSSSLQLEDNTLGSVSTVLTQVQSILGEAGDPTLSDANRAALATQVSSLRDELQGLSNTTSATGEYIFSGFQTSTAPYVNNATPPGASYAGDNGQRLVQVSSARQIAAGDTGTAVFESVQPGASGNIVTVNGPGGANTGSATIKQLSVTQAGSPDLGDTFDVQFQVSTATPPVTTYTVQDMSAVPAQPAGTPQPFTPGSAIALGTGQTLTIDGAPADGDGFQVSSASAGSNANIFTTLDNLATVLNTPASSPAGRTALTNALSGFGTQVNNSLTNVLAVRASVGAREQEASSLTTSTASQATNMSSQLADLTSTNFVTAATAFAQAETSLQAAQKAFVAVQGLSLFSLINP
jgi:flagellar hook-associated protein 3 FlgL